MSWGIIPAFGAKRVTLLHSSDFFNFYLSGTCLYYSSDKTFFQGSKYLFALAAVI